MPARPISAPLLVSCPVVVWNALHDRTAIRFNMINPETVNRIGMVTTDAETGLKLPIKGGKVAAARVGELPVQAIIAKAPRKRA